MSTNSREPAVKNMRQSACKTMGTGQGRTTRRNAACEQARKIQMMEDAKLWLVENSALIEVRDAVNVDILKVALLMLTAKKDTTKEIKDGLWVVFIGIEKVRVGKVEKLMMEKMGKAMEGYKEVLKNLVDVTVTTVKRMAEQAKELAK